MTVPTIETPRLLLRDWREADVASWVAMNQDKRVTEFFAGSYDRARSEALAAERRAELQRNGYGWWVLEEKAGRSFVGAICLRTVPFNAAFTPAKEIGWRLIVDAWGRLYATEAASAALDFAFRRLGWPEVVAMTAALNLRSQRVMQRLGMTHDPRDDFDHPRIAPGNPLRRHVLYRIRTL